MQVKVIKKKKTNKKSKPKLKIITTISKPTVLEISEKKRGRKLSKGRPIKCKYCRGQFRFSKREKKLWKNKNYICPLCKTDLCCLPPTERDLMKLQEVYLKTREREVLGKMYEILKSYADSIIKKRILYITDKWDREKHAHCAAWYLIEHYYNDPLFHIQVSFGAYLGHTIKQAVFDKEDKRPTISLDLENDESKKIFDIPSEKDVIRDIEIKKDHQYLLDYMSKFIFDMGEYSSNSEDEFHRLLGLKIFFRNGERLSDRYFQKFERKGKIQFDKSLEIIKKELFRLNSGN